MYVGYRSWLFALENGINPCSLNVLLELQPTRVAEQEGPHNVHGLTMKMSNRLPMKGRTAYANPEWRPMPLDECCGI